MPGASVTIGTRVLGDDAGDSVARASICISGAVPLVGSIVLGLASRRPRVRVALIVEKNDDEAITGVCLIVIGLSELYFFCL